MRERMDNIRRPYSPLVRKDEQEPTSAWENTLGTAGGLYLLIGVPLLVLVSSSSFSCLLQSAFTANPFIHFLTGNLAVKLSVAFDGLQPAFPCW